MHVTDRFNSIKKKNSLLLFRDPNAVLYRCHGPLFRSASKNRLPPWRPETGRRGKSKLQQLGFSQWPCELQNTDNLPTSLPVAWFYGLNIDYSDTWN